MPEHHAPSPLKSGIEKSPFLLSATRVEVDENVNRAPLRRNRLVVKWHKDKSYSFRQRPKWVKADRTETMCCHRSVNLFLISLLLLLFDQLRYSCWTCARFWVWLKLLTTDYSIYYRLGQITFNCLVLHCTTPTCWLWLLLKHIC